MPLLPMSPALLMLHICCAIIGLLSGFFAMAVRKGSSWHAASGTVFFVSMLLMSGSAAIIAAFMRPIMLNVVAALLTFYLVSTSWVAAKRRAGSWNAFDVGAMLWILAVAVLGLSSGFEAAASPSGLKDRMPAGIYFTFGSVALLFAVSDVRMLFSGWVTGAKRIGRHLWRMSLALLITTLSAFPGQAKLFPKWLRATNFLYVPHVLLLGAVLLWLVRISRRKRAERRTVIAVQHDEPILHSKVAA